MCTYDINTSVSAKIILEDRNSIKILLLRCGVLNVIYNFIHITYTI